MSELLVVIVIALAVIAAAAVVGPRLGVASPLVLVAVGVAASFLPVIGSAHIEPAWILEGILPPLLYSSAVAMPTMNFRREFGAISGLSVLLVVGSALVLGTFFTFAVPGLGFAWGVALGAVVSPTDAVATSIVKRTPVSKRVVAMLDGESLLNDATALVLLRTAIVAAAATFSFWDAVGSFAWSILGALVVGVVVGWANLAVRRRVTDSTVNTVISFAVPFAASVPAGLLGASGLVAAVVAGLVTGIRAPRELSAQNRLSDSQNWRTVELVLEGTVFLTMGVQITAIVMDVERDHGGVASAVLVAAGALALTVLVRAAYVAPLLGLLRRRARRGARMQARLQGWQESMTTPDAAQKAFKEVNPRWRAPSERDLERFARRITQGLATIDYFLREPLGWRQGTAVVWAGMRGAVTAAAAQTLPDDTPQRSALVLIAFAVAVMSLLVQGGTVRPLLLLVTPKPEPDAADQADADRTRIVELLRAVTTAIPEPEAAPGASRRERFDVAKSYRLEVLAAQRSALLDARDNGVFDADLLANELANLDADEIAIQMRGRAA